MLPENGIYRNDIHDIKELNGFLTTKESSTMYLHAPPESGKGVFGNILFHERQRLDQGITTYYSFSTRDIRRVSSTSLLASIIFQILVPDYSKFEKVRGIYATIRARSLWTYMALWVLLTCLLAVQESDSFLFIVNGVQNWDSSKKQFFSCLIEHLQSTSQPKIMRFLFIGSRRNEIELALPPYATFALKDLEFFRNLSRNSVESILTHLIDAKPFLADFKEKLEEKLNSCENGLLLALTAEILGQRFFKMTTVSASDSQQEKTLIMRRDDMLYTSGLLRAGFQLIPPNLADLVKLIFESLPDWAHTALSWVLFAQRPLHIRELRVALALREKGATVEVDDNALAVDLTEDLKTVFGPLIEFSGYRVTLRHEQVKGAFLKAQYCQVGREKQVIDHWTITQFLLKYLASEEVLESAKCNLEQEKWPQRQEPLFQLVEYAALYWPAHYREANCINRRPEELLELLPAGTDFEVWHQIHWQLGGKALRQDKFTWDPFFVAAQLGQGEIVSLWLERRSDEDRAMAAQWASWAGQFEILNLLLQYKTPNPPTITTIIPILLDAVTEASARGHEGIVRILLDYFKERNLPYNWNPVWLCHAAEMGFISMIKLFIKKGAPVESTHNGTSPLQFASRNGHDSVVHYLLTDGHADPDSKGADDACKPILLAALNGFVAVAKLLLDDNADLKVHDKENHTALHLAILHDNADVVDILMKHAVERDLRAKDDKGRTALHLASERGYDNIVQSLVDAWEESVNIADTAGDSPLILST
jgi:ankyrin repeat protein